MVNNIEAVLRRLRISNETFCALADISTPQWSRIVHGNVTVNGTEALRLQNIARELSDLAAAAEPFTLSFKDAGVIRKLLQDRRNGIVWRVGVDVDVQSEPEEISQ